MTEFFRALRRLNPDAPTGVGATRDPIGTPFYSRLEQTLLESPMNQGTAQAWADLLNARQLQGGVANNEIVMSGIQSKLDSLRGSTDKLTKQDLLDQYYQSPIADIRELRLKDVESNKPNAGLDSYSDSTQQGRSSRWTMDPLDIANAGWEYPFPDEYGPSRQTGYRENVLNTGPQLFQDPNVPARVNPYLDVSQKDVSQLARKGKLNELDMDSAWARSHFNEDPKGTELGHQRSYLVIDPNAPGGPQKIYVNTETQSDNLQYVQSMLRGNESPAVLEDVKAAQTLKDKRGGSFTSPMAKSGVYEGLAIRRNIMDALDNDADAIAVPNGLFVADRNSHTAGSKAYEGTLKYQDDKFVNEMLKQLRKAGFKADRKDIRFVSVDPPKEQWAVVPNATQNSIQWGIPYPARGIALNYPEIMQDVFRVVGASPMSSQSKTMVLTTLRDYSVGTKASEMLEASKALPPELRQPFRDLVKAEMLGDMARQADRHYAGINLPEAVAMRSSAEQALKEALFRMVPDPLESKELTEKMLPFLDNFYEMDTQYADAGTKGMTPQQVYNAMVGAFPQGGTTNKTARGQRTKLLANLADQKGPEYLHFEQGPADVPANATNSRGYYVFDLKDDAARSTIKEKGLPLLSIPAGVLSILGLDDDSAAPQPEQRKNGGIVGYAAGGVLGQYEPERREAQDVSFIGRHAQNIDLDKLLEGVRRLGKKEDPKKVWEDLGVFLPPGDAEPRMELPLLPDMLKKRIGEDELLWLPELLDHPDLYKAYPGLQKTVVYGKTAPGTLGGTQFKGYTDPKTGKQSTVLRIDPAQPDLEMLDTLGHETQHIIQGLYEDWPGGGTSSLFEGRSKPSRLATLQREKAINDGIYRMEALSGGRVILTASPYSGVRAQLVTPDGKARPVTPEELGASSSAELEKFVRQGSTPFSTVSGALRPDTPAYRRAEWDLERERAIRDKDQKNLSPLLMYRLLTGEIEAFDVGSRLQKRAKGEDVGTPALLDWRKSMRYDRRNPEPRKKPTEFSSGGLTSLRKSIDSL